MTGFYERARGVVWAKLKPRARLSHNNDLVGRYAWWPVYAHAHADPQLSKVAAVEHYHIAWKCIPTARIEKLELAWHTRARLWYTIVDREFGHRMVIYARDIVRLDWQRPAFARHARGAPFHERPEIYEEKLMGRVGPFSPAAGHRCPHRGAPLEHARKDREGCLRCPWHGIRVHA